MRRVTSILWASFVMLAVRSLPAYGLTWGTPVRVDGLSTNVGQWTSLALDNMGRGHVSYYDLTNTALKYAWYNGISWSTTTIDYGDDVGKYSSIALSYSGSPPVLYVDISWYNETDGDLWHTHFTQNNPPGNMGIVDGHDPEVNVGQYTSIAMDRNNRAHISYYDVDNSQLKYAKFTGSAWDITVVDHTADVGKYSSIALDGNGRPHISYYDDTNDDLKYAYYNGSTWSSWSIDTNNDPGKWTSIAVDSDNHPHISYTYNDGSDLQLKYAYYDGSQWNFEVPHYETNTNVGEYTSIALDPSTERPRISYYYTTARELWFAYKDQYGTWQKEVADDGGVNNYNVGQYTSLALKSSGNPCISYYDYDNGDLYYIDGTFPLYPPSSNGELDGVASAPASSFGQSLPTPFTRRAVLNYELPHSGQVSCRIHDVAGNLVKTLINCHQAQGSHSIVWDGRDERGDGVRAGVYFYRVEARQTHGGQAGGSVFCGKTVLLR